MVGQRPPDLVSYPRPLVFFPIPQVEVIGQRPRLILLDAAGDRQKGITRMKASGAIWGLAVWLGVSLSCAVSDEPAKKFLEKLRENDYYDISLDYLDAMESSPLAPAEFKRRIKFEKAESLLQAAAATRDITQIQQYLDRADQNLNEFAQSQPDPKLLAESERVRARTLFGRGSLSNIQSQSDKLTASEKKALQSEARDYFNRALAVFVKSLEAQKAAVKNFKVDTTDPSSIERRDALWREYVETRFMDPAIREQIADTLDDNDPERRKLLTQAAAEFADVATDYARFSRGSYARIAAARCYKKLGQYPEALAPLVDVLSDNVPRSFKLDAAILAIECWEKSTPPGYAEICGRIGDQKEILAPRDVRDPKIAAVQLGYAKACRMYAEELNKGDRRESFTKQINELRHNAARFAGNVARGSNPLRDAAKKLIAEWNFSPTETDTPTGVAANFADAKSQALDLLDAASQLRQEVQDFNRQLEANPSNRAAIEANLSQKRADMRSAAGKGLEALDLAIRLATNETSREDLNSVRMRQAIAHFYLEDYFEAAVLGEYLLNRYPSVAGSREAAGVAMRAYLQLYLKAAESDRAFERQHLESICNRIVQQWPDEPGTDEAANTLITLALQDANLDLARQLLKTMDQGSPARARLETHIGRMAWNQYLTQSQKPEANPAANQALLDQAEQLLVSGVAGLTPETLTLDSAFGALNLAQLHLSRGAIDKAIAQLETSRVAPLDVIKQKLPPANDPKFVRETYRTALQAYVSGMKQGHDADALLDKASSVVAALRETAGAGNDPAQNDTLVAIYYQLARELLAQLDGLTQPDQKASFAQNLATFMKSLREQTGDGKTLLWIGTTLNSVADKLAAGNLEKIAREYRDQAVDSLAAAASAGFAGDPNAESLGNELTRQQAIALRGQGQLDQALELFVELLKAKPTLVNVQIDAARTLQLRGDQKDDPGSFAAAVAGSNKEKLPNASRESNVVWGWRQIALATKGKESFNDAYFEALYNMAYCRLRYGEILNRNDAKESALTEIKNQQRLFPEMGGPIWKPKFIELAARIQKSLGQPGTGLD